MRPFFCDKCQRERCGALFHSGARKKTCRICYGYRNAKRRREADYEEFETGFFQRLQREEMAKLGLRFCSYGGHWHPASSKWHSSKSVCWPCTLERKRTRYYSTEKRREQWPREKRGRRSDAHVKLWRQRQQKEDAHVKAYRAWLRTASDAEKDQHWQKAGMPWRSPLLTKTEKFRLRYANDHVFATQQRMRRQMRKALTADGIADVMTQAIARRGRSRRVEKELGYSIADLCRHLEMQFTKGMTWEKFLAGEIHIDHIVPKSSFDLSDPAEWRACWALTNLAPLWARDNLTKQARRIYLL